MSGNLRIGFYKFVDETKAMPEVVAREFELKTYKEMRSTTNILWESQPFYFAWSLVSKNYEEYLSIKTKKQKLNFHPKILLGSDKPYSQMSDISRATINFLATASTFLIVSQRLMKNFFGEDSETYAKWNSHRQGLYTNSNPYYACLKEVFLSGHTCFEDNIEASRSYIQVIIRSFGLPVECTPIIFTLDPYENDYNNLAQEYMPVGLHKFIDDITSF